LTSFDQVDRDVSLMCEAAGNHDWEDDVQDPNRGLIPHGYETFWSQHLESKQPIAAGQKGGARYDHFIDLEGWRLIFVDTGHHDWTDQWPAGNANRVTWLKNTLKPGRANILFAHYSRLSRGKHGDNPKIQKLWETLFDSSGPRVAFTMAGHDHNVSVYRPRPKNNPGQQAVSFSEGIYAFVNGAGGKGHYSGDGFLSRGTRADVFFDDDNFCATRINLIDAHAVEVDVLNFGPAAIGEPTAIPQARIRIDPNIDRLRQHVDAIDMSHEASTMLITAGGVPQP
jgi:hypothetical protein